MAAPLPALAQIHAAFTDYYDHREALDQEAKEQLERVAALRAESHRTSPVIRKLQDQGLILGAAPEMRDLTALITCRMGSFDLAVIRDSLLSSLIISRRAARPRISSLAPSGQAIS